MARWESESVEPCSCRTLTDRGLLQPEGYMRTVLSLRRPLLDQGTVEQRVTARLGSHAKSSSVAGLFRCRASSRRRLS
ncbi:hypothetical protein [Streptomyces prasinus]|uniref:hypothetical protein n=1 Tax=Streptomyces prasinus TaxID=67345 RepID=UPI003B96DA7D